MDDFWGEVGEKDREKRSIDRHGGKAIIRDRMREKLGRENRSQITPRRRSEFPRPRLICFMSSQNMTAPFDSPTGAIDPYRISTPIG